MFFKHNAYSNSSIGRFVQEGEGQSSVELALVLFAFLSFFLAAQALWRTLHEGLFVKHALQSLSHQVPSALPGLLTDIFLT